MKMSYWLVSECVSERRREWERETTTHIEKERNGEKKERERDLQIEKSGEKADIQREGERSKDRVHVCYVKLEFVWILLFGMKINKYFIEDNTFKLI